jgi:soluble lytic murein transglycosylase-like protein
MRPFSAAILILACGLAVPFVAQAASPQRPASTDEANILVCLQSAATTFGVDVLPLVILRQVEAGSLGHTSGNTNGSYDIGPMQINSSWLPRLARLGITETMVRDDACVNAYVGTWIYSEELKATGNIVSAMARYHSPNARHQLEYLGLVRRVIQRNLARLPPPSAVSLAQNVP